MKSQRRMIPSRRRALDVPTKENAMTDAVSRSKLSPRNLRFIKNSTCLCRASVPTAATPRASNFAIRLSFGDATASAMGESQTITHTKIRQTTFTKISPAQMNLRRRILRSEKTLSTAKAATFVKLHRSAWSPAEVPPWRGKEGSKGWGKYFRCPHLLYMEE